MEARSSSESRITHRISARAKRSLTSRLRVTLRLVDGSCGSWMTWALGIHRDRQDRGRIGLCGCSVGWGPLAWVLDFAVRLTLRPGYWVWDCGVGGLAVVGEPCVEVFYRHVEDLVEGVVPCPAFGAVCVDAY